MFHGLTARLCPNGSPKELRRSAANRGIIRRVRRIVLASAALLATTIVSAEERRSTASLKEVLERAGERVERFFTRAQSIVCLEIVRLQALNFGLTPDGPARTVESELRLSWEPTANGDPSTEAQTLRQLLKVNGHPPRRDDWDNCTAPEQQTREPQPLSMLLPSLRTSYAFSLAGEERVDGRAAITVDYRFVKDAAIAVDMVEGRDDCLSFDLDGGLRGRLWIDAETFDVLRLDQRLIGLVDIPLPRIVTRRPGSALRWTIERWDTSIRFKAVSFQNPEETLVLPSSLASLRITRGSGNPRLRTMTDYKNYQRFLTGARVVGE